VGGKGEGFSDESVERKAEAPDDVVERIVREASLREKLGLMSGGIPLRALVYDGVFKHYNSFPYPTRGLERFGLPPIKFVDGPRGVVCANSTCFPVTSARGATWDPELEFRVGGAIAKEVRSVGGNFFGGVCINLLRHPANGRAQEAYGEDSFHMGEMAKGLVKGVQSQNVMACVKHFALNNQENTRFKINVTCSERVLREVFLPHFFEAIIEADAASVMGAYNLFRGSHCCENAHLLRKILKDDWGFKGFVISDFGLGIRNTRKAVIAGCDIEMPCTMHYGSKLAKAVKSKNVEVDMKLIDESVKRIASTVLDFHSRKDPLDSYPDDLRECEEHVNLALEVAEKSIVLLKNEDDVLPIATSEITEILLVGRLAKSKNIGDLRGSSNVYPSQVKTPFQGFVEQTKNFGNPPRISFHNGKNSKSLQRAASRADLVVLVVGSRGSDEGEYLVVFGGDRKSLSLRKSEISMINTVGAVNSRTVVALVGGSAIMCEKWRENVPCILMTFFAGMEGGSALARTVLGLNQHTGGKLPFSVPKDINDLVPFDPKATKVEYGLLHGYTKIDADQKDPAFAFGHGLSFTTFELTDPKAFVEGMQIISFVKVTNTGERAGDEVVQFYVRFHRPSIRRPQRLLKGFQRVSLKPGESTTVEIRCKLSSLCFFSAETNDFRFDRSKSASYGVQLGTSSRNLLDEIPLVFTPPSPL